jgi:hypothetical protein
MYANLDDSPTILYNTYPQTFRNTLNYPATDAQTKYSDNWRDVVFPTYDTETQYLGDVFFDVPNDYFTYPVINKTDEEIQAEKKAQTESEGIALAQQMSYNTLMIEQQAIEDPQTNLDNSSIFPFWNSNNVHYEPPFKVNDFDVNNEVRLYRCEQPHNSQTGWEPRNVPALWTMVAPDGEIYVWIAPTGAQDSYQIGDKVHYPTITDPIYVCIVANCVWAPDVYGWVLDN